MDYLTSINPGLKSLLLVSTVVLTTACGGGGGGGGGGSSDSGGSSSGYTGSTSPATADSDNADDLATAATEASIRAIETDGVPLGIASTLYPGDLIDGIIADIPNKELPTGFQFTVDGNCGGTYSAGGDDPNNQSSGTYLVTFNDYCVSTTDLTLIYNGEVEYIFTSSRYEYVFDLDIDYEPDQYDYLDGTLTGREVCTQSGDTFDCTYADDFNGRGGLSYRAEDIQVSGNSSSGYNVSGRVYTSSVGYVDFQATNLIQCDDGRLSSGTVTITDSTGNTVIQVTFSSCDSMTVTFNGVSETVDQP